MALTHLQHSPELTLHSKPNGEILSSERISIQRLLRTCGPRSRIIYERTLLDLIVYNRISPTALRVLNSLSQSHLISLTGHGTPLAVIPLCTLGDSICSESGMTGPSSATKRLLNVWSLIGQKSGTCGPNFWAIVGPCSITEYLATLSSSEVSLLISRKSGRSKPSKSTRNSSSIDGSNSSDETLSP